jgi:hypothetical protein
MTKIGLLFFGILLFISFFSCTYCIDNNEPYARFEFRSNHELYNGVYGVLPSQNLDTLPYIHQVPLSIVNDTTTLVFF